MAPPRSACGAVPSGGDAGEPAEPDSRHLLEQGQAELGDRLSATDLGRLRWSCRRGMLENDLLIERFFAAHGDAIDRRRAAAISQLMDLSDGDLLDLLLARRNPQAGSALDAPDVHELLALMRPAAALEQNHRLQSLKESESS